MKRWFGNRLYSLADRFEMWAEWLRDRAPKTPTLSSERMIEEIVRETLQSHSTIDCNNALLARLMRGHG